MFLIQKIARVIEHPESLLLHFQVEIFLCEIKTSYCRISCRQSMSTLELHHTQGSTGHTWAHNVEGKDYTAFAHGLHA